MGNVTVPTPVFVAGGALCLLAGYLIGAVTGPDAPDRATAEVASYAAGSGRLCLSGDGVSDRDDLDADDQLCGQWRRAGSQEVPRRGDEFRFVTIASKDAEKKPVTVIYGNVVD